MVTNTVQQAASGTVGYKEVGDMADYRWRLRMAWDLTSAVADFQIPRFWQEFINAAKHHQYQGADETPYENPLCPSLE